MSYGSAHFVSFENDPVLPGVNELFLDAESSAVLEVDGVGGPQTGVLPIAQDLVQRPSRHIEASAAHKA